MWAQSRAGPTPSAPRGLSVFQPIAIKNNTSKYLSMHSLVCLGGTILVHGILRNSMMGS